MVGLLRFTRRLGFPEEEDSLPVIAPPTEAQKAELDEDSGHQTRTEMLIRGQNEPLR